MNGIVIAGFGGIGKTELAKKYENVIDLESILWKWIYEEDISNNLEYYKNYKKRVPNPNYPQNYINKIKENCQKYDIVCVAYSDIICKELKENAIDFFLCYPEKGAKDVYLERYEKRGNNLDFINGAKKTFEEAVSIAENRQVPKMILHDDETLEDYLIKNGYQLIPRKEKCQ